MRNYDQREFAFPNSRVSDPRTWASERMFFAGLGEADDSSMTDVTPSGVATRQAEVVFPTVTVTGKRPAETPWWQPVLQAAVPVLTTAYAQNQMTKVNIARINQGQAPLTATQYAAVYQPPSAQVQVGPTAQATNMLLWIGGGLALLVGLRAAKVI